VKSKNGSSECFRGRSLNLREILGDENRAQKGGKRMDSLKSHYRLPLGLDKNWDVANVALDVTSKYVTISMEYRAICN
jgi:hypothetical protein